MDRMKVRNGTNASLQVKARVNDPIRGIVESSFQILPGATTTISALHIYRDEMSPNLTVLWHTIEDKGTPTATAPPQSSAGQSQPQSQFTRNKSQPVKGEAE